MAYNDLVVNYAKAKSNEAHAEENFQVLALGNNQLSTAQFDQLYSYFTQAVAAHKAQTLQTLYNGVRAYNCASMQASSAFEVMASLDSFDNADSTTLDIAFNTALKTDLQTYLTSLDTINSEKAITFSRSGTNHSFRSRFHNPVQATV